jgi:hypothetical protein
MTNWKARCAELANHLQGRKDLEYGWWGEDPEQDLLDRTSAELAQPESSADGEVGELVWWFQSMRELAGDHNPEEQRRYDRAATLLSQLSAPAPAVVPVAWCRSDEFANSMNRGGSFNGWKDPGAGANKCDMQLYAIPMPQAGEGE